MYRVAGGGGGTDFPEFHAAGRHVLEHRARQPDSLLHRYLPSVDVAWALLGSMPLLPAAAVWYVLSGLTWLGLLRSVGRHLLPTTPAGDRRIVLLTAALLSVVFVLDHLLLGAFHILMLWLMVAGLGQAMAGRRARAAVLLGVAIWLKLLPLLGAVYLAMKRRWAAAIGSVVVAVVLDVVLSVAAYGASAAWTAHVQWWHSRAVGDVETLLLSERYTEQQRDRNQSMAAVMRRLLTQTAAQKGDPVYRRTALTDLSPSALVRVYFATLAVLVVAVAFFCRKAGDGLPAARRAAEIALVVLATMWFSPIVFSYHGTAALPALAVVLGTRWERSLLKRAALIVWVLAALLLALPEARSAGELLWASLLLGAVVAITGRGPVSADAPRPRLR